MIEQIDYIYKTKPYKHQHDIFMRSRDMHEFAYLLEQGTGKTKINIDNMAWLYGQGKIDLAVIIAPHGVHYNWADNEIPAHMPDYVPYVINTWDSGKVKAKARQKERDAFVATRDKLKIFCINYDALNAKDAASFVHHIMHIHANVMLIIDESHMIKNPKALRSKAAIKLSRSATYRRINTGTPIANNPLDLYMQFHFLNPVIMGFSSYYTFRNRYADLMQEQTRSGHRYRVITGFKNLDELSGLIEPYSARVTKAACLDLPPKVYEQYIVELSDEQRKIYNSLKDELIAELGDDTQVTAQHVLTKLLRLQQVIGGFVNDDEGNTHALGNRRIEALMNILESCQGKAIIWARFRAEIEAIKAAIIEHYGTGSAAAYYGDTSSDDRRTIVNQFQDLESPLRFIVANQATGGTGITLHAASTVVYYSNDFNYANRIQSEDRAHRIGQINSVCYIDMVAKNSIDYKILRALKNKQSLADMITGDNKSIQGELFDV